MDVWEANSLRWRAMGFLHGSKNLFKEQYYTDTRGITQPGKIAGNIRPKLCMFLLRFISNISGFISSFGLACVAQDIISVLHWIAAGPSRTSIWERLGEDKVRAWWWNWRISWLEAARQGKMDVWEANSLRWRAIMILHGSKNLFKEQYYTDTRGYNTGREDCKQY